MCQNIKRVSIMESNKLSNIYRNAVLIPLHITPMFIITALHLCYSLNTCQPLHSQQEFEDLSSDMQHHIGW
jgi:hypothetical protein